MAKHRFEIALEFKLKRGHNLNPGKDFTIEAKIGGPKAEKKVIVTMIGHDTDKVKKSLEDIAIQEGFTLELIKKAA